MMIDFQTRISKIRSIVGLIALTLIPLASPVFAQQSISSDFDQDGVPFLVDTCPSTSPEDRGNVDEYGCTKVDDDADGVYNAYDACPGSPNSEPVRADGCMPHFYYAHYDLKNSEGEVVATKSMIDFEKNKATVQEEFAKTISYWNQDGTLTASEVIVEAMPKSDEVAECSQ